MYKKVIIGLIAALLPLSFALAKDDGQSDDQGEVEIHHDFTLDASSTVRFEHGEAEPGEHGEKRGLFMHFGTTTPPGFFKERHASSSDEDDNASSTKDKDEHGHRGFIGAFLEWLFNLPSDTTVGDLRAHIIASSTATTTASTTPALPKGLGFWAKLFEFLHWGNN